MVWATTDKAAIDTLTCPGGRVCLPERAAERWACRCEAWTETPHRPHRPCNTAKLRRRRQSLAQHAPLPREPVAGRLPAAPGWGRGTPRFTAHPGLLRRNAGGGVRGCHYIGICLSEIYRKALMKSTVFTVRKLVSGGTQMAKENPFFRYLENTFHLTGPLRSLPVCSFKTVHFKKAAVGHLLGTPGSHIPPSL